MGRSTADEIRVVHGSIEERKFVALYRRGNRLIGALGLNWPKLLMQYYVQIGKRVSWDEAIGFAREAE